MSYFDDSLDFEPVAEQNTDPILPEDRFVFELTGLERSQPDQWRKKGGVKWTFRVSYPNGQPFMFQDEPYEFWRNTNINAAGKPMLNVGTNAHEWASALLGRDLGIDESLKVREMRGAKMSAMVVWERQKGDPKKKSIKLASLKHVPTGTPVSSRPSGNGSATAVMDRPEPGQVSANATLEDVDRALVVSELSKRAARLKKLNAEAGKNAADAIAESDLDAAPLADLQSLSDAIQAQVTAALDD